MKPTSELPTAPLVPPARPAPPAVGADGKPLPISAQPTVYLDPDGTVPTHLAPTQDARSTIATHLGITPGTASRTLPEVIGGYRRLRLLGTGGMAQVFEAEHTTLSRKVALKLLKPNVAESADFALRFLRESHAMAQVSHPNVVAIYDAGEADGMMYMALELVTGGDLHKLMKRRGRLSVDDALAYLIGCTKGLEAIHQAGLVHRDIKPANIFLDKDGTPKMGDLGLARAADGEDRMTMTGNSWGTPSYMSPEQVKGVADLDIRADIYSLGATLYTLLVGVEPYVGETSYVITHKVLTEPPPDPRAHDKTIPPQVAAVIAKAMTKDRTRRYQTPRELLDDLERARAGQRLLHTAVTAAPVAPAPAPRSSQAEVAAAVLAGAKPTTGKTAGRALGIDPIALKAIALVVVVGLLWLVWRSMQGTTGADTRTPADARPAWAVLDGLDEHGRFAEAVAGGQALRMRWCPPMTFRMGSPVEEAGRQPWENLHQATIATGFWMLSTEVTQGLYASLMGANPSSTEGATLPVEGVSLAEAEAFCARLAELGFSGARLPTEREWEFACRAGTGTGPFAFKPTPNEQGWMAPPELVQLWRTSAAEEAEAAAVRWITQHVGDGDLGIKPVGTLAANGFGLFDMHGNVMEWCSDSWDGFSPYGENASTNTAGDLTIVRGGCWFYPPERCRAASRLGLAASSTLNYVGFRVVVPDGGGERKEKREESRE